MQEIWKDIDGFDGIYEVSNMGNVRSNDRLICLNGGSYIRKGRTLKQFLTQDRFKMVRLSNAEIGFNKLCLVNRLVANAFISNPMDLPYAMHISGDNLDNRAINLQWATPTESVNKHTAQSKRKTTQKILKVGTMPNDAFMDNQIEGRIKSIEKRKRSVMLFCRSGVYLKTFDMVRNLEIYLGLGRGNVHTYIKRGLGEGRYGNYIFRFND